MGKKVFPLPCHKRTSPVNYLVQKSKYSRPIISHIDKLKTWETDNPPKSWVTDDFDRRTDDAGVAGDRDPDNGDVGINGPGGDDEVTTPKHQPTSSARLNDVAYVVQNDEYHDVCKYRVSLVV